MYYITPRHYSPREAREWCQNGPQKRNSQGLICHQSAFLIRLRWLDEVSYHYLIWLALFERFFAKKSPLGVFSRADPELSSYPFWLKLKMLSHPMWGYLSEYFRHLLSFSDLFLKTAYVAVWTLPTRCVIQEMGTFCLFSKTATSGTGLVVNSA